MAEAPIDCIPLYVKAGSIIPMTEFMNYVDERTEDPLKLRIYTGQDAAFELYKDAGDGYSYERGEYEVTKLVWSERNQTLTKYNSSGEPIDLNMDEYQIIS